MTDKHKDAAATAAYINGYDLGIADGRRIRDIQQNRIDELEAEILAGNDWLNARSVVLQELAEANARIAALEAENEQLKQELKRWRVTLNKTGEEAMMPEGWSHRNDGWR